MMPLSKVKNSIRIPDQRIDFSEVLLPIHYPAREDGEGVVWGALTGTPFLESLRCDIRNFQVLILLYDESRQRRSKLWWPRYV